MVAWEVAIGRIRSACDNSRDKFGISLWQYGLLREYAHQGADRRFINELRLESIRQESFPEKVSRLKGVYFFESERDAHMATERWGIGDKQKYICEVNFSASNITRVDSEWITSFLLSSDESWMKSYWGGEIFGDAPLTEILASGIGVVHNNSFRSNAYRKVMETWPYSTFLLAAACFGFTELGLENIAQMVPALFASEGQVEGAYFINMNELHQNEERIAHLLDEAGKRNELPPVIRPPDPGSIFHVPDMSCFAFTLGAGDALSLFESIHVNSV
ncbi:hypothetical protein [Aphanothece minutissima]|uniref:hypothetical protein n=1 Tax=Aphanothece minutissima TaxID=543815 RepID=UPI001C638DA7|nr:hypothetical protein [Aphanothece minutissima]